MVVAELATGPQGQGDDMEEDEFANLFEGITAYIAEKFSHVMLDEVRAEFWEMVNGDRRVA